MKILAWDTSSKVGCIAAIESCNDASQVGRYPFKLVCEWSLDVGVTHSERLLWAIHGVLQSARWNVEEVGLFGVGIGPGSFTGLRIGVTTARTLAHTLRKPLIGVSSLAALARPVSLWLTETKRNAIVIAATDACKGELFSLWGNAKTVSDCVVMAQGDEAGLWKRGVEEQCLAPIDLIKTVKRKLKTFPALDWISVGEGRNRYSEIWKELPKGREIAVPTPMPNYVQGRFLGSLVWEAHQAGLSRNPLHIHPRYMRASDAELKLKAGILRKAPTSE